MRTSTGIAIAALTLAAAAGPAPAGGSRNGDTLPDEWRNWSRFREIRLDASDGTDGAARGLARVAMPEELFREARSDLADLRIVDDRGRETGYVIFSRGDHSATEWRSTELSEVGFVPGRYTQVVADAGADAELHNAVEVTLPRAEEEFFTWVETAASEDGETWRIVRARAPLYRFRERGFGRAVTIRYPRTRDRWLRLRLLREDEEVPVERLRVAERIDPEPELTRIRRKLSLSPDSPEGESWWEPGREMHAAPIAAVRLATEQETFHRPVQIRVSDDGRDWRQVGEGTIYRYGRDGTVLPNTVLPNTVLPNTVSPETVTPDEDPEHLRQSLQIDVRNTAAPFWRVVVLDRGDPPIPDLEVTLMQSRRYAVFRVASEGSYRLLYGNDRAEAPEYEIENLVSRDNQASALLADLGPERENEAWVSSAPFTERHPALLWTALILAVVVLSGLALKSLRR